MKAQEDSDRKVAFITIPGLQETTYVKGGGCSCQQQCCCTCFKITMPSINNSSIGIENRQRLLSMIEQLEAEYATQRETIKQDFERQMSQLQNKVRDAQSRAQTERTAFQNYLNRPQPTVDENPSKLHINQLQERLISVERERDTLLRNKVTFIEANLSEKNMHLENEIECLKLNHKDELAQVDKAMRDKEAQLNGVVSSLKDEKTKLQLRIKALEGDIGNINDTLVKQTNNRNQERQKGEDLMRQVARLKAELQSQGQVGKSEMQIMRERIEQYKERLVSAENKHIGSSKEKDDHFKLTIEQKAELERRDRIIKEIENQLRYKEQLFNNRTRQATAEFQSRLRGLEEQLAKKESEKQNIEKEWNGRLSKHQTEMSITHKNLQDQHLVKLKSLQEDHGRQVRKLEEEWGGKVENLRVDHLRQTIKPSKSEPITEYVYIEKVVQSPELKITTEKLLQLTSKSVVLETQIEDLKLENAQLKEKFIFLNNLEGTFGKEKQKWRLEREELLKRLGDLELRGDNKNRFEWAVEKIIDAEGHGKEHFRYREGGIRVVDSTTPNIIYRVISPSSVYQSVTERIEGDLYGMAAEQAIIDRGRVGVASDQRTFS